MMNPAEWNAHVAEKYPDYRIVSKDNFFWDSYMEGMAVQDNV
jgi:hypothetical protein